VVAVIILFEMICSFFILLGLYARIGALILIVYLSPITLIFHNFWILEPGQDEQIQFIMFLTNLAIIVGLCIIAVFGAGPISLDYKKMQK